jgi:polysaccharide deacetylase 2 family uncharacterized protein YibQ
VYLIQSNNTTCRVTESYEEWDILIQKLKERNSQLLDSDTVSESGKNSSTKEEES